MKNLLRALLLALIGCPILASCDGEQRAAANAQRLATDVHVTIADHALVLPFTALERYAYRGQSFSLDREGDAERARNAANEVLRDGDDPAHPLPFDELSVVVRTYGWNDSDMRQRQMCALLRREWARSVCDNPWAAIQQALPANRFRLMDLRQLKIGDPRGLAQCVDTVEQRRPLPQEPGEATMVCAARVYGGDQDEFHHAVVRIDGELGALWTVWRYGQYGESAEAMTQREGQAIVAFVQHALGKREDFATLHRLMCGLRRPGSIDAPDGADCPG